MPTIDRRTALIATGAAAGAAAFAGASQAKEPKPMSLYPTLLAVITAWRHQDVEGVLKHLTDDIVWQNSAGYNPPIVGKAAMRATLTTMAARIKTNHWRIFDHAESGDRLFMEGVDEFWTKDGAHIAIPYAGSLHFRGPLIAKWTEYFDGRLSAEQTAKGGPTPHLAAMIDHKGDPQ